MDDSSTMNDTRANWAQLAVDAFQKKTGTDDENAIGDLICNLLHLAERNGADALSVANCAAAMYREEVEFPEL